MPNLQELSLDHSPAIRPVKNSLSDFASVILTQSLNHASVELPRSKKTIYFPLCRIIVRLKWLIAVSKSISRLPFAIWRDFSNSTRESQILWVELALFLLWFLFTTKSSHFWTHLQEMINESFMITLELNGAKNKLVNMPKQCLRQTGIQWQRCCPFVGF